MSPILVQNTTEVAKLSSSANIISSPLAKMRARPATTPPVLPGHSRGNSSVETGVQLPWTDARERSRGDLSTVQMEGIGATAAPRGLGRRDPVYPTEFLGCMSGAVRGDAVIVQRSAPAD